MFCKCTILTEDHNFLHTGKGFPQITPVLAIHSVGKIKIENFHVFDIHWLYRMSRYVIVIVHVTERIDVTKRDDISSYGRRLQSTWLHYQSPLSNFRTERCARKRIYHGCKGQIEKSVSRDHSLTSLGKPRDARQLPSRRTFISTPHTHDRFL